MVLEFWKLGGCLMNSDWWVAPAKDNNCDKYSYTQVDPTINEQKQNVSLSQRYLN